MAEREWDAFRLASGLNANELAQAGSKIYPQEAAAQNQQAHRLGSKLLTDRYGPLVSQGLGGLNELYERQRIGGWGDAYEDIGANVRGAVDSLWNNPNSPQGLLRAVGIGNDVNAGDAVGSLIAKFVPGKGKEKETEAMSDAKPWDTPMNPAAEKLKKRTSAWKKKGEAEKKKKKPLPAKAKRDNASTAAGAGQRQKGWLDKIKESGFR